MFTLLNDKIKTFDELNVILTEEKAAGKKVVLCHGVFDLLHPGHIRHFREAKEQGDLLVVSITPDHFVNKGPDRPAFNEQLRLESLASLQMIDYVVLNTTPDAIHVILQVKPDLYVKGKEYKEFDKDVTGKIQEEAQAIESVGGALYFTDDVVFSSSSLINKHIQPFPKKSQEFIKLLKEKYTFDYCLEVLESLTNLKVAVVGDAIIDEYQYIEPLGQSGKGTHLSALNKEKEVFLGGSLIIANHLAEFSDHVTLFTALGSQCPQNHFIHEMVDPEVDKKFFHYKEKQTLTKKRYIIRESNSLNKIFETYSANHSLVSKETALNIWNALKSHAHSFDLILVCDFGNGFLHPLLIDKLNQDHRSRLAVNTQMNSGNRGFNIIHKYQNPRCISINEPEIRLAYHDNLSPLEDLVKKLFTATHADAIFITRGSKGVLSFSKECGFVACPVFSTNIIDRVGAGDSFFSLVSLCTTKGIPLDLTTFFGSLVAALDLQLVGNQDAVKKEHLYKFLTRIFK